MIFKEFGPNWSRRKIGKKIPSCGIIILTKKRDLQPHFKGLIVRGVNQRIMQDMGCVELNYHGIIIASI